MGGRGRHGVSPWLAVVWATLWGWAGERQESLLLSSHPGLWRLERLGLGPFLGPGQAPAAFW